MLGNIVYYLCISISLISTTCVSYPSETIFWRILWQIRLTETQHKSVKNEPETNRNEASAPFRLW